MAISGNKTHFHRRLPHQCEHWFAMTMKFEQLDKLEFDNLYGSRYNKRKMIRSERMHIHHDHIGGHSHDHEHTHSHTHEHIHDGVAHTHAHDHAHEHDHQHPHDHDHLHGEGHAHTHSHECSGSCSGCASQCEHTPMEELLALMKYMVGHNAAHAKELADLAIQLEKAGSHAAYEQVMAAVSDFEKGNMRLSVVLSSLNEK